MRLAAGACARPRRGGARRAARGGAQPGSKRLAADPAATDAAAIKDIEARTNHDVKAVEYWIRGRAADRAAPAAAQLEWVHFGCTSEDINNLAYALMLQGGARAMVLLPDAATDRRAARCARRIAMRRSACSARTHGQAATPTTVGKELANVAARLHRQRAALGASRSSAR